MGLTDVIPNNFSSIVGANFELLAAYIKPVNYVVYENLYKSTVKKSVIN